MAIAFVLSLVTGAQWIQRTNETVHTQAEAFTGVDTSCSTVSAELASGERGEASHGGEAEVGAEKGDHAAGPGRSVAAKSVASAEEG